LAEKDRVKRKEVKDFQLPPSLSFLRDIRFFPKDGQAFFGAVQKKKDGTICRDFRS
jgi:hypothetical protein